MAEMPNRFPPSVLNGRRHVGPPIDGKLNLQGGSIANHGGPSCQRRIRFVCPQKRGWKAQKNEQVNDFHISVPLLGHGGSQNTFWNL
jgi:hypothetical protein